MNFLTVTIRRAPFQSLRLPFIGVSNAIRMQRGRYLITRSYPFHAPCISNQFRCVSTLIADYYLVADRGIGEGSGNNYAYLVSDDKTREAVIIDPAHPEEYVTTSLAWSR